MTRTSLVIDLKQRRPACILLQACSGGDPSTLFRYFDSEDWLVSPTGDMRMVSGTPEEWKLFSDKFSVLGKKVGSGARSRR